MTVLVCGVNSKQAQRVKAAVGNDILIAGSDESPKAWRRHIGGATVAVVWTRFCSHNHVEALQTKDVPLRFVYGGLPSVIDAVNFALNHKEACHG
jgi:hypothetical protein